MSGREADSVRDSTIQKQELKSEIKRTVMKKITKKLRYVMAAFVRRDRPARPGQATRAAAAVRVEHGGEQQRRDATEHDQEIQQLQPALGERSAGSWSSGPAAKEVKAAEGVEAVNRS